MVGVHREKIDGAVDVVEVSSAESALSLSVAERETAGDEEEECDEAELGLAGRGQWIRGQPGIDRKELREDCDSGIVKWSILRMCPSASTCPLRLVTSCCATASSIIPDSSSAVCALPSPLPGDGTGRWCRLIFIMSSGHRPTSDFIMELISGRCRIHSLKLCLSLGKRLRFSCATCGMWWSNGSAMKTNDAAC